MHKVLSFPSNYQLIRSDDGVSRITWLVSADIRKIWCLTDSFAIVRWLTPYIRSVILCWNRNGSTASGCTMARKILKLSVWCSKLSISLLYDEELSDIYILLTSWIYQVLLVLKYNIETLIAVLLVNTILSWQNFF